MKTLNLALVGCGGKAHAHAQNLLEIPEAKIVALCDNVAAQTRTIREKFFPDAAEFSSYDALLDKVKKLPGKDGKSIQLDGVVLVTPHTLHHDQAKNALERGLHVLCEKPMVTSSPDAYDLWKTVKKSGKLLAVAYQSPYSREFGYLAAQRDAGRLGKIQLISAWLSQGWLKWAANTWRQNPALSGGGMLYDSGAHLLNAFMWLINDPVVEVACFYNNAGAPVDINGVAIVKFANGVLGSICIGGNCPPFRTEIQIQTDKMLIVTDQYGRKLEMTGNDDKKIYPHVPADDRPAAGTPSANFVAAILHGEPLRAPVRYGVLLSALMDAMYQSAREQKPVRVKPVPADILMSQGIQFAVVASALTDEVRLAPLRAREAGFAGLQFDVRSPLLDVTDLSSTGRRELLHLLSNYDQQLVGLRTELAPQQLIPGADLDRLLDQLDEALSAAAQLRAPLLCLDVGPLPAARPSSPEPAAGLALAELARRADRQGVILALRSELSSFADLAAALEPIACPWLGIDLDPVAILRDHWKLDQVFARLGPLVRHLRGRDALAGSNHRTQIVPLGRGSTPWRELLATLDAGGFKGWLTLDPIDLRDRPAAAIAGLAYLHTL